MPKLNVTIKYGAQTNDDIEHMYTFNKVFELKNIPNTPCRILLHDKELESVWFEYPIYDPETDTYFITDIFSRDLERYEHTHHRRFFIAFYNAKKFEKAGWKVARIIRKHESFDPFSKGWNREGFIRFDKNYVPDEFSETLQQLLEEVP